MPEQRSIELRLKANISDFKSQIDSAADAASGFGKAIEASSRKVEQARDRQRDAAQRVVAAEKRLAQMRASDASASKIASAEKELARAKNLNKAATAELTAAEAAHAKAQRASTTMGQLAQSVTNNADVWNGLGSALTRAGLALGVVVVAAGVKMSQFESAMSQVKATGADAKANLDGLRETALRLGADTAFSATEAAEGITNLLKAGMQAQDVIGGGLAGTLNLAAAGELAVADAAEIAATALTVFGLKGGDMAHVADLLAAGAGKAQGEVSDLAVALKYIGPVAAGMGISIEETVGALSAFASQGILADQAGTSLRGVLMSMTSPSGAARKEMDRLGISLYDGQGKFRGLSNVAGQLAKAYTGVSDQAKDASLGIIFGNAQVTAARVLFKSGAEGIEEWTRQVNEAGYAARAAATMMDNLGGDVERLGGAIDTALIKGGGGLNQWARGIVQDATGVVDAIGSIPAPILEAGTRIAGIGAISALAAGGIIKLGVAGVEAAQSWKTLKADSPKVAAGITKVGKAAAIAGGALAAIEIVGIFGALQQDAIDKTHGSLADMAEAIANVAASSSGLAKLDAQMAKVQTKFFFWETGASQAKDMGDAIKQVSDNTQGFLGGMSAFGGFVANLVQTKTPLQEMQAQLAKVDESLVQIGGAQAAVTFDRIADAAGKQGVALSEVQKMFPEYESSLKETAVALGVTNLKTEDYANWMRGKIPSAIAAASAAHPDLVGKLSDVQQAALGGAQSLEDYVKELFNTANAALAVSGSQVGFERTMENTTTSVKKLIAEAKKAGDLKNLTNIGTEEGRKGIEILNGLATAAVGYTSKLITAEAPQEEIRLAMARARAEFVASAKAMGYTATEAGKLADARGLVPKNINLKTTDEGTAQAKARTDALRDSIKGLPKSTQTKVMSEFQKGGIDDAYAALRKIDKKKAEAFIKSILDRDGINDWNSYKPKSKTAYVDTVYRTKSGQQYRASGGSVFGPGSETSDSIPAMLSNNEHVWSALEVRGAGGHGAMERLRAMAREGRMPAFRDGGPVVWSALAGGDVQYFAKGGAAKKAAAKAKREALEELARELGVDVRRGNITDDVLGGSGLSRIDQLLDWSRDTNLSKSSRDMLAKKAAGFEKQLTGLQTKLTDAEKQADSLGQTYDQVKSALGSFDLAGALESGRTQSFDAATGRAVWSDATASSIAAQATKRAATLKTFSDKIAALVKAGASGSVVQEIVALGSEQGIKVADMFLSNPDALKQVNQAYADIDKWSGQAAQNTTEAFAKGGKAAADALVKSLEDQLSKLGEDMAKAFAAALGLKVSGDKLKKKAAGGHVLAGQTYLVGELGPELFTATQNGHITTAAQTQQLMTGGGSTVYNLHVDGRRVGMDPRLEQAVRTIVDVAADAGNLRNAGY
ncbi:MAG TPA: phage tail tape measure protein [Micropruina sp.]|nr:phage tail tape measure protein [Micropruina sp.]